MRFDRTAAWRYGCLGLATVVLAGAAVARVTAQASPTTAASPTTTGLATFVAAVEADMPLLEEVRPAEAASPRVISGPMEAVLYGQAGVDPTIVAMALRLLGHRLDLTRDLALGDTVRLIIQPGAKPSLDYVELRGVAAHVRLYRAAQDSERFVDEDGQDLRRGLMRTPLERPRVTSGFGLRRHPLLGYTRRHRGVDFGAPVGTPVLAAADGVVEGAGWAGGYGRLVRLRHADGLQTTYGHLSAWLVSEGQAVRQGAVIARTGNSGLSTGPHLHFEVLRDAQALDPALVQLPRSPLSPAEQTAFNARKRAIDGLLTRG